jgi:hypothetical protein
MALKSGLHEVQQWSYEDDTDPKTVFHARGMTKREYDDWIITYSFKRGLDKEDMDAEDALISQSEKYRICIKKIENAEINGNLVTLEDPDKILGFILEMHNTDAGTEFDQWLNGLTELTATEKKESSTQSGSEKS